MTLFNLRVVESWEHMVFYRDVEADTLEQAYQAIKEGEWSPSDNDVIEDGDTIVRCWEAWTDDPEVKLQLSPEMEWEPSQPQLDRRELATVLAALRYYQSQGLADDPQKRNDAIHDIATDGDEIISMCGEEIDALCEKLNFLPVSVTDYEADKDDDEQCPECQRSFGPHYTGPCNH